MLKGRVLFIAIIFMVSSAASFGEWIPMKDLDSRMLFYRASYHANEDYSSEEEHSLAIKVLNKRSIEDLQTRTITYSASVESVEIIDAYTEKADGTRIDAPKDNYQVRTSKGRGDDGPVFSDRVSITTVFPEVDVGDTLVFRYKRFINEPMFPQYFTISKNFYRSSATDEVTIDLSVPDSFAGLHQARGMEEKIVKLDGRVSYRWQWQNKEPMRNTRKDYSVWDKEENPGFAYSTFGNYQAVAEAYGKRAEAKAVVSDRVKALADKIVGREKNKRKQAQLMYEWVAEKITYAGNCVGVGAVVPHDLSFVLDNHMGDCKDHATLLQALLSAKGIKSIQALVNSGRAYKLPTIPAVSAVNHVINYLPEFEMFVDSTSPTTPFEMLPSQVQGKPVLLVRDYVEGMKTPVSLPGSNVQTLVARLQLGEDGAVKGDVSVSLNGDPAVYARAGWRNASKDNEDLWLKDLFTRNGQIGSATMKKDDPRPLRKDFSYSMSFEQKEFLMTDSAGAFAVFSPTPTYMSVFDLVSVPDQIEDAPVFCSNGTSREKYVYTFPANFKVLDYPRDKVIDGKYLHYEAKYNLKGNVLTVSREIEDSTPGPTCSPDLMAEQVATLQKINRNLRGQIVYKPLIDDE